MKTKIISKPILFSLNYNKRLFKKKKFLMFKNCNRNEIYIHSTMNKTLICINSEFYAKWTKGVKRKDKNTKRYR